MVRFAHDGHMGRYRSLGILRDNSAAGCQAAVVQVLRDAGRRLTVPALVEELGRRGLPWTRGQVENALATLKRRGRVEHVRYPGSARGGYGLRGWK